MKACVCSDSHGNSCGIAQMLRTEKPDALIFLGDGGDDVLRANVPAGEIYAIAGNCDIGSTNPDELLIELFGKRILLVHGHKQRIKLGKSMLTRYAKERGASVVLYGHTHTPDDRERDGILMLNPGSMGEREEKYIVLYDENGSMKYEYRGVRR